MTADEKYMKQALTQAKKALLIGEVPIGCVIVFHDKETGDRVIGRGYNRRNTDHSTLSHAEMTAIKKASRALGDWRLEDCTLYVTLEPCPMCAAALNWAQVGRIVYGAPDPRRGCTLYSPSLLHPRTEVVSGVLADDCSALMRDYFKTIRK